MKLIALSISTALLLSMNISATSSPKRTPSTSSKRTAASPPTGKVAASPSPGKVVVDGHVIPMDDIVRKCLLEDRDYVVDQMIQAFVVDREAKWRGIVVSDAAINQRIDAFRKAIAPSTVAATLKQHRMSMSELREAFRVAIERDALTAAAVKPVRMVHCYQIRLRCTPDGVPKAVSGAHYTGDEARHFLAELRTRIANGADFVTLASQYGEPGTSDLGVLYDKMLNVDAGVLDAALKLKKGDVTVAPVKTSDGYCLIQAVSTTDDHPKSENALYRNAAQSCRKMQIMFLQPKVIGELIAKCKITFTKDADILDGGPVPSAAAFVDGHPIPMSVVAQKCLANVGHQAANIAIEDYVVDRECKRRGITVSEREIDAQVEILRRRIAPESIEQGLAAHHTTTSGLRNDFRQQIEREKLVMGSIAAPPMAHTQVIFIKSPQTGDTAHAADFMTAGSALARLADIRSQIDRGASFDDLARQYSEMGNHGDLGILYTGAPNVDTAILGTALKMKAGEITPAPIQTYGGYFLLRVVSTEKRHPADEDRAYATALNAYRTQEADLIAPQAVNELVKKARVVNYL